MVKHMEFPQILTLLYTISSKIWIAAKYFPTIPIAAGMDLGKLYE